GLHQVKPEVAPFFDTWMRNMPPAKIMQLGEPFVALSEQQKKQGKITWENLVPHLNSWNGGEYSQVSLSTVCAYLLLEHLRTVQLENAYTWYNFPDIKLDGNSTPKSKNKPTALSAIQKTDGPAIQTELRRQEISFDRRPEDIITLATAYKYGSVDRVATASLQVRVAQIALRLGVIDNNLKPIGKDPILGEKFAIDGRRGDKLSLLIFLIYQKSSREKSLSFADFQEVFGKGSNLQNMLQGNKSPKAKKALEFLYQIFRDFYGEKPHLFLSEEEWKHPGQLNPKEITFANRGLWAKAQMDKYVFENWQVFEQARSRRGSPSSPPASR